MSLTISPLLRLPPEVFREVVFELAATQPLGPPYVVLPLLRTCRATHKLSAPDSDTVLWSRIFRYKFDSGAVTRRAFTPSPSQCVDQLIRYCQSMQAIRTANRCRSTENTNIDDITLEEALLVAMTMMMEDDGKNMRQLEEWAELRPVLWSVLKHRLYEGSYRRHGWAQESQLNACTLWLMWMLTTEESLQNETAEERDIIRQLILPFVVMPYRYASVEAPPHHFNLPWNLDDLNILPELTTVQTVHGPYPLYPSLTRDRAVVDVHYGSRPVVNLPLIAPAAILLYFAREEMRGMPVPPHFARDREEWIARGNDPNGVGITKADVDEWNWGWAARLPGGVGNLLRRWSWGAGDEDLAYARDFEEDTISIADVERALGLASAPAALPVAPSATTPATTSTSSGLSTTTTNSTATLGRWAGKAPHSQLRGPKSKRWDADWWRFRMCGNPARPLSRVPYGRVYEPGCMDGLWHGRMMMPSQNYHQDLLMNVNRPMDFSPEATFGRIMVLPLYARFRETHRVVGQGDPTLDLGSTDPDDENMNNAWFDGEVGSTQFKTRGSDDQEVEVTVNHGNDRSSKAVLTCYHHKERSDRGEGRGLGNEAWARKELNASISTPPSQAGWSSVPAESTDTFAGYDHDEQACSECESRRRIARQLRLEQEAARQREQMFASVGLGFHSQSPRSAGSSAGSSPEDIPSSLDDYDSDLDEWEPYQDEEFTPDGILLPAIPRTHDRRKLAKGRCDGVQEIYLFGETDARHSQAFKRYRFYGRVRAWDGLIGVLRTPVRNPHAPLEEADPHPENFFFYGYLVGGENFVGQWRIASIDPIAPAWEGPFVMSRRED